jgi:DNA polymerase-3 subunit gamma/tau
MGLFPTEQGGLDFPVPLSEKYRPRLIKDFLGLAKEKKILAAFCRRPMDSAFLFVGPSGIGKTTMALAMALEMGCELHHIPSQKANVENVEDCIRQCWYVAANGGFHLVLVDEADAMSNAAQLALLSKLDATARPPKTIFVFTCNDTARLEKRFLSRCMVLEFSSYGMRAELASFLAKVWDWEVGHSSDLPEAQKPDFERVAKDAQNNCRNALMRLEIALLAA